MRQAACPRLVLLIRMKVAFLNEIWLTSLYFYFVNLRLNISKRAPDRATWEQGSEKAGDKRGGSLYVIGSRFIPLTTLSYARWKIILNLDRIKLFLYFMMLQTFNRVTAAAYL